MGSGWAVGQGVGRRCARLFLLSCGSVAWNLFLTQCAAAAATAAAGLEEVMENLILDQLDVGQYGPALLDPDFELDHVFD